MIKFIAALLVVIAVSSVYNAHHWWKDALTAPAVEQTGAPATRIAATSTESPQSPTALTLTTRLQRVEESLAAVTQSLQSEQSSTLALQREVLELRDQLERQFAGQSSGSPDAETDHEVARVNLDSAGSVSAQDRAEAAHAASRWYQELANPLEPSAANLEAAGADPDTAKDIQRRLDEYTLAELEVRDTAAREGWLQNDDFAAREAALLPPEVDVKAELGEEGWDRFLYLQGRNNRVRVESVINGSAAANAGIAPGDLILVYAAEKIYTVGELQAATRAGQRGEVVTVRLNRQGTVLDTTIERGPLGVMLGAERVAPDSASLNP